MEIQRDQVTVQLTDEFRKDWLAKANASNSRTGRSNVISTLLSYTTTPLHLFSGKVSEQVAQEKVSWGLRYLDRIEVMLILRGWFCQLGLRLPHSRLVTCSLSSALSSKERDGQAYPIPGKNEWASTTWTHPPGLPLIIEAPPWPNAALWSLQTFPHYSPLLISSQLSTMEVPKALKKSAFLFSGRKCPGELWKRLSGDPPAGFSDPPAWILGETSKNSRLFSKWKLNPESLQPCPHAFQTAHCEFGCIVVWSLGRRVHHNTLVEYEISCFQITISTALLPPRCPWLSTSLCKNSSAESATLDHWFNRLNQLSHFMSKTQLKLAFKTKRRYWLRKLEGPEVVGIRWGLIQALTAYPPVSV